jgi:hypothetical protein
MKRARPFFTVVGALFVWWLVINHIGVEHFATEPECRQAAASAAEEDRKNHRVQSINCEER